MRTEKPNTLIIFCQNRGYKKLPKNIPVENLGRDITKRFLFRRLKFEQIDARFLTILIENHLRPTVGH